VANRILKWVEEFSVYMVSGTGLHRPLPMKLDSLEVADWEKRSDVSHRAKLRLCYKSERQKRKKHSVAQPLTIRTETV
jgi:hypothetical protein